MERVVDVVGLARIADRILFEVGTNVPLTDNIKARLNVSVVSKIDLPKGKGVVSLHLDGAKSMSSTLVRRSK